MKTIKLWDGIRVTTADDSEVFESPAELWDAIHIEDKEVQAEIIRQLYCFGKVDLSAAYGQTVILTAQINKEDAQNVPV